MGCEKKRQIMKDADFFFFETKTGADSDVTKGQSPYYSRIDLTSPRKIYAYMSSHVVLLLDACVKKKALAVLLSS